MRTYYSGPDALVNDERFVWHTETPRVFFVRDLHDVVVVRRIRSDRGPDVAMLVSAVFATLAVMSWLVVGVVVGAAVGFGAITVATVAVATRRHRPTHFWQLRATYLGAEVVVFEAVEERVFNQVKRALRRSLEVNRPAVPGVRMAAA
jgi:hypothetical protein